MDKWLAILIAFGAACVFASLCIVASGAPGVAETVSNIKDPTERGLAYVAGAILIHAVLMLHKG